LNNNQKQNHDLKEIQSFWVNQEASKQQLLDVVMRIGLELEEDQGKEKRRKKCDIEK